MIAQEGRVRQSEVQMLRLWLDESFADGVSRQGDAVVKVQPPHHVVAMAVDGLDSHIQGLGDFFLGCAPGDVLEYFNLTGRDDRSPSLQRSERVPGFGTLRQSVEDIFRIERFAAQNGLQTFDQIDQFVPLGDEPIRIHRNRLIDVAIVYGCADEYDFGVRLKSTNIERQIRSQFSLKIDVNQRQIACFARSEIQGILAIGDGGYDLELGNPVQEILKRGPNQFVIINQQDFGGVVNHGADHFLRCARVGCG